jgi:serine protease
MQSVPANPQSHSVAPPGPTIQSRTIVENGITMHVLPARGVSVLSDYNGITTFSTGRAGTGGNLTWHGGPVQTTPKIYVVYWGSKWTTGNPEYTTLNGFLSAIGGHSWINIDTQYTGSNGAVSNPSSQLAGTWIDPSSVPRKPSSSAVGAEAQKAALHFGYGGVSASYIVAIQSGNDPSGFRTSWCAWHSSESESEGIVSFTNLPYQSDAGYSCGAGSVNSPGTYDGVSIVGGHEEAETQTDPQPNSGWLDSGGAEIGDKCAWINLQNNSNAGGYPTQPLWDNKVGGCAQSGP